MGRALITIHDTAARERASKWVRQAPFGTRVEFKETKRTLPQNDRMWAMLSDIAAQKLHCEERYTPDVWKNLMMHACGREMRFLPSLDNKELIPIAYSSSDLSKGEMSELIEFMLCWGAENGVVFHEPDETP